jgi:(R,R)-butanediol dehydrogenase/meso-butanediol dehydrogenase/diacetyl reductase
LKAAVFHGRRDIRLEDVPDPVCGPEDVIIAVEACGICGTDMHAYRHGPTLFAKRGQVLGHEFAGRLIEVGANVIGVQPGDRVTAWPIVPCDTCDCCRRNDWHLCRKALGDSISSGVPGAFAEFVRVPRARPGRTLYKLPDKLGPLEGALVEPLSVGLHAASLPAPDPDATTAVIGLGPIGLGVVQALRASMKTRIVGSDPSAFRRHVAQQLGADATNDPEHRSLLTQLRGDHDTASVDVVIECSGSRRAFHTALDLVRPGGTIVLVGLYGREERTPLDFILTKEIRIQGAYAYRTEYDRTISLLSSSELQSAPLITHQYPLERISEAFAAQDNPIDSVKVMVTQE